MTAIKKITILSLGTLVLIIAPAAASTDEAASEVTIVARESEQSVALSVNRAQTPASGCGAAVAILKCFQLN